MQIRYDSEADAMKVMLSEPQGATSTGILDDFRFLHYDETGEVYAVEFIEVSKGVNLDGVPCADEIAETIRNLKAVAAA